jgi:hypothetical protein
MVFHSPTESSAVCYSVALHSRCKHRPPTMSFAPLQRFPRHSQLLNPRFSTAWVRCALRFSQPLSALFQLRPPGLFSCRSRSWGCTLQGLALRTSRFASQLLLPSCRFFTLPKAAFLRPMKQALETLPRIHDRTHYNRNNMPRLQGFSQVRSPFPSTGGLDRSGTDALLGFYHSRVLLHIAVSLVSQPLLPRAYHDRTSSSPAEHPSESRPTTRAR